MSDSSAAASGCPYARLYGPGFTADPYAVYEQVRSGGPVGRVELEPGITAWLVVDYATIMQICRSGDFSRDARRWRARREGLVPDSAGVLVMMEHFDSAAYADGEQHHRLRTAISDALALVDETQAA